MSELYQLTPHLNLRATSTDGSSLLAQNVAQQTHLELTKGDWLQLHRFARQRLSLESARADGAASSVVDPAIEAGILVGPRESITLSYATTSLRFEIEALYRQHCNLRLRDLGDSGLEQTFRRGREFFRCYNEIDFEHYHEIFRGRWLRFLLRYISGVFEHLAIYEEQLKAPPAYQLDPELCFDAMFRPEAEWELEQQPCMPVSSTMRAAAIAKRCPEGGRVLVLGDDDMVGLALAPYPQFEIHIVEVDTRLLDVLRQAVARRNLTNVTIHDVDLQRGLPDQLKQRFKIVVTDPPYAPDGMAFFLSAIRQALLVTREKVSVFLSTNPGLLEDASAFWEGLALNHFMILKRHRNFNRYLVQPEFFTNQHFKMLRLVEYPLSSMEQLLACPYYYADFFELLRVNPEPDTLGRKSLFRRRD